MKEEKLEEKIKLKFLVGERCLARWRDNRRFVATISNDLGNGKYNICWNVFNYRHIFFYKYPFKVLSCMTFIFFYISGHYEIIFDDGFQWKCSTSRLYKLKDAKQELSIDTSMSPTPSTPSPTLVEAGPSTSVNPTPPVYHTHLFDPTRDYLGSKSERREMKRKLNIKEIFNIGQKKQRRDKSVDKEKMGEKKTKVFKKNHRPVVDVKSDIKTEVPGKFCRFF